jgi:hypothetical protein
MIISVRAMDKPEMLINENTRFFLMLLNEAAKLYINITLGLGIFLLF